MTYLILVLLAFTGGALYPPSNYDALSYRFARVLHWTAEGRWHWIATCNDRINLSGAGSEWLMAPAFALARTDRLFFLPNIVSALILPGLIFSCFTSLGVRKRVTWHWMWLIPTGYCFILQAGSIGNDTFAAPYLLAAIVFARRAAASLRLDDFAVSTLAAGLLTGVKVLNVPLILPWLIAIWPALRIIKRRPVVVALIALIAVCVSFAPVAVLNYIHSHSWAGDPTNRMGVKLDNPIYGFIGNSLQLVAGNFILPLNPYPRPWNTAVTHLLESPALEPVVRHYPRIALTWGELPVEEAAGVGIGICVLTILGLAGGLFNSTRTGFLPLLCRSGFWISAAGVLALVAYMAKVGSESAPRLIAAYYPIVFCFALLWPWNEVLVRRRWWQWLALITALSTLPAVILTPSRPLWPAQTLLRIAAERWPESTAIQRAANVYRVYAQRPDAFASLRRLIPPDTMVLGFVCGGDDLESPLWRPFDQGRRVVHVGHHLSGAVDVSPNIVVASKRTLKIQLDQTLEEWLAQHNGKVLGSASIIQRVQAGAEEWFVLETLTDKSLPGTR